MVAADGGNCFVLLIDIPDQSDKPNEAYIFYLLLALRRLFEYIGGFGLIVGSIQFGPPSSFLFASCVLLLDVERPMPLTKHASTPNACTYLLPLDRRTL